MRFVLYSICVCIGRGSLVRTGNKSALSEDYADTQSSLELNRSLDGSLVGGNIPDWDHFLDVDELHVFPEPMDIARETSGEAWGHFTEEEGVQALTSVDHAGAAAIIPTASQRWDHHYDNYNSPHSVQWTAKDADVEVECQIDWDHFAGHEDTDLVCQISRRTVKLDKTGGSNGSPITVYLLNKQSRMVTNPAQTDALLAERGRRFAFALNTPKVRDAIASRRVIPIRLGLQSAWKSSAQVTTVGNVFRDRTSIEVSIEFRNDKSVAVFPADAITDLAEGCGGPELRKIGIHVVGENNILLYPFKGEPLEVGPLSSLLSGILKTRIRVDDLNNLENDFQYEIGNYISRMLHRDWAIECISGFTIL